MLERWMGTTFFCSFLGLALIPVMILFGENAVKVYGVIDIGLFLVSGLYLAVKWKLMITEEPYFHQDEE